MLMQDFDHFNGSQLGAHLDNVAQEMGFEWEDGYKFARVSNQTLGASHEDDGDDYTPLGLRRTGEDGEGNKTNRYVVTDLTVTHTAPYRLEREGKESYSRSGPRDFGRITTFTLGGDAPSLEVRHETLLGHAVGNQDVRNRSELTPSNLDALKRTESRVIPTGWSIRSVEPSSYIDTERDRRANVEQGEDHIDLPWRLSDESIAYHASNIADTSRTGTVYEQKMPHPEMLDSMQKVGEDLRVSHREEDPDTVDATTRNMGDGLWFAKMVDAHQGIIKAAKEGMSTKPRVAPGMARVVSKYTNHEPFLPEMILDKANVTEDGRLIYADFSFNNLSQQFDRMPD